MAENGLNIGFFALQRHGWTAQNGLRVLPREPSRIAGKDEYRGLWSGMDLLRNSLLHPLLLGWSHALRKIQDQHGWSWLA